MAWPFVVDGIGKRGVSFDWCTLSLSWSDVSFCPKDPSISSPPVEFFATRYRRVSLKDVGKPNRIFQIYAPSPRLLRTIRRSKMAGGVGGMGLGDRRGQKQQVGRMVEIVGVM